MIAKWKFPHHFSIYFHFFPHDFSEFFHDFLDWYVSSISPYKTSFFSIRNSNSSWLFLSSPSTYNQLEVFKKNVQRHTSSSVTTSRTHLNSGKFRDEKKNSTQPANAMTISMNIFFIFNQLYSHHIVVVIIIIVLWYLFLSLLLFQWHDSLLPCFSLHLLNVLCCFLPLLPSSSSI